MKCDLKYKLLLGFSGTIYSRSLEKAHYFTIEAVNSFRKFELTMRCTHFSLFSPVYSATGFCSNVLIVFICGEGGFSVKAIAGDMNKYITRKRFLENATFML